MVQAPSMPALNGRHLHSSTPIGADGQESRSLLGGRRFFLHPQRLRHAPRLGDAALQIDCVVLRRLPSSGETVGEHTLGTISARVMSDRQQALEWQNRRQQLVGSRLLPAGTT